MRFICLVLLPFLGTLPGGADKDAAPSPEVIAKFVAQLGNEEFGKREAASATLTEIGRPALPALRVAAKESTDAEIRDRAARLINEIEKGLFGAIKTIKGHHQGQAARSWVTRVAMVPGTNLAVASGHDDLRIWDLKTGKQVHALREEAKGIWSLAVSADGSCAIAGGNEQVGYVFDLKTGNLINELRGHRSAIWGVALSKDGKEAVTLAFDKTMRIWSVENAKATRTIELDRRGRCLAIAPDGKYVAVGLFIDENQPATIGLWNLKTGEKVREFEGHSAAVTALAFNSDGTKLVTSSFDRTARLWNVSTGKELQQFGKHETRVEGVAMTSDGNRVVTVSEHPDAVVRVFNTQTGRLIWAGDRQSGGLLGVALLPDGRQAVTVGKDNTVKLWSLKMDE